MLNSGCRVVGPVLLEDYQLVEKLAQVRSLSYALLALLPVLFLKVADSGVCLQFDRERIPERVVHARGASAKGFFEVSLVCAGLKLLFPAHTSSTWLLWSGNSLLPA